MKKKHYDLRILCYNVTCSYYLLWTKIRANIWIYMYFFFLILEVQKIMLSPQNFHTSAWLDVINPNVSTPLRWEDHWLVSTRGPPYWVRYGSHTATIMTWSCVLGCNIVICHSIINWVVNSYCFIFYFILHLMIFCVKIDKGNCYISWITLKKKR